MARRPSATALLLLLLSLLTVAHCRTLESEPATDASTAETTTLTIADETSPPNPADATASAAGAAELAVPEEQHALLRLPSHLRHRHHPCRHGLFHSHLWWARQHGNLFGDGHRFRHRRVGDAELVRDGEPRVAAEEVKPVVESDPDRSITLRDSNGEGEDGDDATAVKRWRMFGHGLRHHRHHHHHHEDEEARDHDNEEGEDEEKEKKMRKSFHFHHADEVSDDELEEMVRRFRKAILRRRFRHHLHHHGHHHHHTENAEQADGEQQQEEGGDGVMSWVKGLMNRF